MCGIAGFAGENRDAIERMIQCLIHRGPDGNAVVITHGASLGHARLAILDPRPIGDQPMWNEDKTIVIVYNGEIFNFRQLKAQYHLECKTGTDTEVLLKLYEREGIGFVKKLIGMFAFGIYDTRTSTWHVARDTSGIKPLFIAYPQGKLHFASEMRSLMSAMPEKPPLNWTALSQYMRLQYVPGPDTLCEGIQSLPPGTILTWTDGRETRKTFSTDSETPVFHTKQDFQKEFPILMNTCVQDHLISDKPIGIFLSGGMDSSIILHHMAQHVNGPVKTFTVRFDATQKEGAQRFNTDADLAAKTAAYYGTDHTELLLTAELFRDYYKETTQALDQPNADSVSVAQFLLAKEAKKHVDVILTGAGGDELFGGYPRYRIARILQSSKYIPADIRSAVARLTGHPSDILRMEPGAILAERLLARPASEMAPLIRGQWYKPSAVTQLFSDRFAALPIKDPVRSFMEFDRHLWLVDESLRLADATTMGSSVEGRVPFLDPRIIAAAHATPSSWHVTWRETKALLKETYRPILPDHLFTLKKASFYPPLAKWFRRETAVLIEETLEHQCMRELFDMDAVKLLYEKHKAGEYHLHTLSTLTQLRYWLDTVYEA
ncbi:MAG: hypothetical protein JWM56_768 [Candidatus Peribacteria bacterium]|nr:hypothetical protein [Candidatus Peribacteria bacterium]